MDVDTANKPHMPSMFAGIAKFYDPLNRLLSLGIDQYWRKRLIEEVFVCAHMQAERPRRIVDIAAGTLDVSLGLYKRSLQIDKAASEIIALDICQAMLSIGQKKCVKFYGDMQSSQKSFHKQSLQDLPLQKNTDNVFSSSTSSAFSLLPLVADAESLPLPTENFDAVTIAFGIRNMPKREKIFQEIWRVLRPGGKLCLLEFGTSKNKVWQNIHKIYLTKLLPFLGGLASDKEAYAYLAQSILAFPKPEVLAKELENTDFINTRYYPLSAGIVWVHTANKPKEIL